jgi:ethanolamine ammonia-lyase small subunit
VTQSLRREPDQNASPLAHQAGDETLLARIRRGTPARILVGRAGLSYPTAEQLALRLDHAAALDAVRKEVDLQRDLGTEFVNSRRLFEVQTSACSKEEYLLRPDFGRKLSDAARESILNACRASADVQIAIGDGLSASAVAAQVPQLLPLLEASMRARGWTLGQTMFIRYCRVGIMNDLGDLLLPRVVILLIGERPGLATAESLSAYLAWQPRAGQTDADRNLISNIHAAGVPPLLAAPRILALVEQLFEKQTSGVTIKDDAPSRLSGP